MARDRTIAIHRIGRSTPKRNGRGQPLDAGSAALRRVRRPGAASAGLRRVARPDAGSPVLRRVRRVGARSVRRPADILARAMASSPPDRALFTISAMFARTDAPSVIDATLASSQGVSAAPRTPVCSASRTARSTASRVTSSGSASASGTGVQMTSPEPSPSSSCARTTSAAAAMSGTLMRRPDPAPPRVEARYLVDPHGR